MRCQRHATTENSHMSDENDIPMAQCAISFVRRSGFTVNWLNDANCSECRWGNCHLRLPVRSHIAQFFGIFWAQCMINIKYIESGEKKMQQKHLNDINIFNWTRNLLINTTMRSDRNDITLSVKCNIAIMSSRLEGHRFRWIHWHRTHIISIELLNWLWWQVDDQSIHIHFWWRRWHSLSISSITRVDGELWSVY